MHIQQGEKLRSIRRPNTHRAAVLVGALLFAELGCSTGSQQADCTAPPIPAEASPGPALTNALPMYKNSTLTIYQGIEVAISTGAHPDLQDELEQLYKEPMATWLNGEWESPADVSAYVTEVTDSAAAAGSVPLFVPYNIPGRDAGEFSAGGIPDAQAYRAWTAAISAAIGEKPAVIILEPDSLASLEGKSDDVITERLDILRESLRTYQTNNLNTQVYVDGGHSAWLPPDKLAALLKKLDDNTGVVRNVSLNVSNFRPDEELNEYAKAVSTAYCKGLRYLLDTGRNDAAVAPAPEDWCNPRSARTAVLADEQFSAAGTVEYAVIKPPGESDGDCGKGDPPAGTFDTDLLATYLGEPSGHYTN